MVKFHKAPIVVADLANRHSAAGVPLAVSGVVAALVRSVASIISRETASASSRAKVPTAAPRHRNASSRAAVVVDGSHSSAVLAAVTTTSNSSSSSSPGSNDSQCLEPVPLNGALATDTITCANSMLHVSSLPVGGRLREYWRHWQSIGASKQVVRWLRDGYMLPFRLNHRGLPVVPPLHRNPPASLVTSYSNPTKQAQLDKMLHELLGKRAIREVPLSTPAHFSRVFLVPKKNGKMRMVIDLSLLNQWLDCPTFQLDHAQVVRESLAPGMWATSIDLSDAYLHIPIHPLFWPFLVFQVGSKRYQFMVLPFGLSTAPRVFSAVMKALKKWARRHNILLFQYLDDWLMLHLLTEVLQEHTLALMKQCTRLGLLVNFEKSETAPMQSIVFLGDHLEFASGFIYPT